MKPRSLPGPNFARSAALSLLGAATAVAVLYLLLWYGPDLLATHDIGNVTGSLRALRLQEARDAARGRLLTLGAAVFAAGALVYTARNFALSHRAFELTEQGQVTDRYTKAIEQLGSDKLDVRIGGIYALERVARDSPRDHPTVMDVLSAFIREHSHEEWWRPAHAGQDAMRSTRPDVQAATAVVGRRDSEHDIREINLTGANLPHADLTGANLTDADLTGVDLTGADLGRADLSGAHLYGAVLANAHFFYTDLRHADLQEADVFRAFFFRADLTGADLSATDLTGASFSFTDLTGANLFNANVCGAGLSKAKLTGALLTGAILVGADLSGADLTNANLSDDPRRSEALHSSSAELHGRFSFKFRISQEGYTGTNLCEADLTGANITGADLTGAQRSGQDPIVDRWSLDLETGTLRR